MADNGGITLRGSVLDIEHKSGEKNGKAWGFWIVYVLTGKQVSEVRYPSDEFQRPVIELPKQGDTVNLDVTLDVFNGKQQIEARSVVSAPGLRAAASS